ncbi:hypothetical protein M231_06598 [Tremella mesenterica]|uniref:Uncharacterized protein n=1 Tax=Tremella mesenterica TaxID=5217 RepID=A0A4Q1BD77_TREME|nr:hypothetical protein M231_06598 [Tremella mesenterica]
MSQTYSLKSSTRITRDDTKTAAEAGWVLERIADQGNLPTPEQLQDVHNEISELHKGARRLFAHFTSRHSHSQAAFMRKKFEFRSVTEQDSDTVTHTHEAWLKSEYREDDNDTLTQSQISAPGNNHWSMSIPHTHLSSAADSDFVQEILRRTEDELAELDASGEAGIDGQEEATGMDTNDPEYSDEESSVDGDTIDQEASSNFQEDQAQLTPSDQAQLTPSGQAQTESSEEDTEMDTNDQEHSDEESSVEIDPELQEALQVIDNHVARAVADYHSSQGVTVGMDTADQESGVASSSDSSSSSDEEEEE